jgi:hypothetical protein
MFSLATHPEAMAANRVSDTIAGGYTEITQKYFHPNASRNALGLVGGNEVSQASGNLVDIESDLRGTTRDLSNAPSRKYQPSCLLGSGQPLEGRGPVPANMIAPIEPAVCQPKQLVFTERSTGRVRTVATEPRHLPTTQYASYPGVPTPDPLVQNVYGAPWRF